MSDKTPHWPGADGKPGVSFGPKSLPENEGEKSTEADADRKDSATAQPDAARPPKQQAQKAPAAKDQPGQSGKALAVPGRSNKQVGRADGKPGRTSSQPGKPQQGDKKTAAGAKAAPQALPGPVVGSGQGQGRKPGDAKAGQARPGGGPAQRTPRPMPQQNRAALPGAQSAKGAAAAGAGAAAASSARIAGDTAKAAPWAAAPAAGTTGRPATARDKSHKPEGTLSKKVGEARRTRKARLRISRVDPWSVMKTTFLFSIAFGIMLVIIVAVLWGVVAGSGALGSINSTMNQLIGDSSNQFKIEEYINASRVIGFAAVIAALDVVIITAVSTLFAFLYNLAAAVIGGLEVTLAED